MNYDKLREEYLKECRGRYLSGWSDRDICEWFIEKMKSHDAELLKGIEGKRLGGHRDEEKRIYAGGYDQALDDVKELISNNK